MKHHYSGWEVEEMLLNYQCCGNCKHRKLCDRSKIYDSSKVCDEYKFDQLTNNSRKINKNNNMCFLKY